MDLLDFGSSDDELTLAIVVQSHEPLRDDRNHCRDFLEGSKGCHQCQSSHRLVAVVRGRNFGDLIAVVVAAEGKIVDCLANLVEEGVVEGLEN